MPNKIQIKRTTVTGRTPNTTNSSNTRYIDAGELSLNLTDAKLFSSDGTNYFEVGSNLNSIAVGGTFTANATLVNAAALNVVNQTNTATLYVTTSANVASAFLANSTGAYHSGIGRFGGTTNRIVLGTGVGTSEAGLWVTANTTVTTIQAENQGVSYLPVSINPNGGAVRLAGTFGTTNGVNVTNVSIVVGNSVANATLSNNVIQIANSTSTANLTPTTLAIGSITVNSALANLQALNVVNQTNTGTLFVTTSANVGTAFTTNSTLTNTVALNVVNQTNTATLYVTTSANVASAFLANSTGAYHTGTMNAASHTVGTTTVVNSTAIALGPFGTTNGVSITTTSLDIGNTTANAALDYNIIYVANSTGRANLTPTTLAIGSITVNSALANLQALNVVNQTNTGTLFVTTSANVASAFLANSTGAYHTGTINAASHTVGTNFTSNNSQMVLNAPSYTVSFSNTNGSATNFITWSTSLQQAVPSVTTRSIGTKIIFYDGLSGSTTDWAYGLAGSEMWASVGTTTGTFRWYAVTTSFMSSNTTFLNHNAQVRVGGGVGTTNGVTITNTSIAVGNSTINTSANSTAILVNGTDLVATQKRSIAMSLVFGR